MLNFLIIFRAGDQKGLMTPSFFLSSHSRRSYFSKALQLHHPYLCHADQPKILWWGFFRGLYSRTSIGLFVS